MGQFYDSFMDIVSNEYPENTLDIRMSSLERRVKEISKSLTNIEKMVNNIKFTQISNESKDIIIWID